MTRRPVVFFDLDETLLDQRTAEALAAQHLLEAHGDLLPTDLQVSGLCRIWRTLRERHVGGFLEGRLSLKEQRRQRMRALFAIAGHALSDREADERFAFYLEHYRSGWKLFDDVVPCLDGAGMQTGSDFERKLTPTEGEARAHRHCRSLRGGRDLAGRGPPKAESRDLRGGLPGARPASRRLLARGRRTPHRCGRRHGRGVARDLA